MSEQISTASKIKINPGRFNLGCRSLVKSAFGNGELPSFSPCYDKEKI